MNVARTVATAALLLLPLLAIASPGTAFTPSAPISGVFLRTGANGPTLGFGAVADGEGAEIPLQTAAAPASGAPPVCVRTPTSQAGQCVGAVLGIATSPSTFAINGIGAFQLWLSTEAPAPIVLESVMAKLYHVNASGGVAEVYRFQSQRTSQPPEAELASRSDDGGNPVTSSTLTLSGTPARVALADQRSSPIIVLAGETLTLSVEVVTPVSGPDPLRIVAHYGRDMPSGVLFQLAGQASASVRVGTSTLPLFPTGTNVTFHPIDNETDQVRTFPVGTPAPPSTLVDGSTLTFGPTPLDESAQLAGDGLVVFTVASAPGAVGPTAGVAFDVKLQIGEKVFTAATNLGAHTGSDPTTLSAPIRIAPGAVQAGENVTLSITLFSPKADNFVLIFGSSAHPSGVHLPVVGGGRVGPPAPPVAPVTVIDPPEEPDEEPEEPGTSPEPQPNPSASQGPAATGSQAATPPAGAEDDGVVKTVPPRNTPSAGFALFVACIAGLAVALRAGRGKGS